MSKGLPRSLSRGSKSRQVVSKITLAVNTTVTVSATGAAIGFGTTVIGDLPEGYIKMIGAAAQLSFAGSGADANLTDTWAGDFGIGTTPASDATITDADVNIIASTALGPAVAEVAPVVTAVNATDALFDNTDGSLEINLNVLIDAANITDDESANLTVTGVVEVTYITLLDD